MVQRRQGVKGAPVENARRRPFTADGWSSVSPLASSLIDTSFNNLTRHCDRSSRFDSWSLDFSEIFFQDKRKFAIRRM